MLMRLERRRRWLLGGCILTVMALVWPMEAPGPPPEPNHWHQGLIVTYNYVCLTVENRSYKASTLGLPTGSVVQFWNETTQTWTKSYTVGVSPPFKDFYLYPQYTYVIAVTSNQTMTLYGPSPSGTYVRAVYPKAGGGWVNFGYLSTVQTRKMGDVVGYYSGAGSISTVQMWNATAQAWRTWSPGSPPFKNLVVPAGTGLWVYITGNGNITYTA